MGECREEGGLKQGLQRVREVKHYKRQDEGFGPWEACLGLLTAAYWKFRLVPPKKGGQQGLTAGVGWNK